MQITIRWLTNKERTETGMDFKATGRRETFTLSGTANDKDQAESKVLEVLDLTQEDVIFTHMGQNVP